MKISRKDYAEVMRLWHGAKNFIATYTDHGRDILEPAMTDVRRGRDIQVARLLVLENFYKGVIDGLILIQEGRIPSHYTVKGLASIQRGCRDAYCVGLTAGTKCQELEQRKRKEGRSDYTYGGFPYQSTVQEKARWIKRLLQGDNADLVSA